MKIDQQLLEQIILEVAGRLTEKPKLLLVYETTTTTEKIEYLTSKFKEHWRVEVFNADDARLKEQSDYQQLVFLDVNQDLLARGAMGLTDTLSSSLLAKALLHGQSIFFEPAKDLQWLLEKRDQSSIPERVKRYQAQLLKYKKKLHEFGVWFGFVEYLRPSQHVYDRKLLTERDIQKINTSEIWVASTTIITNLARDAAKEKGIQFRVDHEEQI
ncbi:hypothetical protein [Neobacillus ginsengisoli]|uniref:Ethanolamine utilization protein n=1 Tax=Neobacillus ginsengisoli TaxID=904295 RepID=A0ABT9XX73_9BACI|nr:hypothetical protein [Neobacillus ginsengisoli]MDQ0199482.1 hypothetical protein [Neobacillus ginsengisoli]